ncbi:ribokinase [Dactylosporangium sp. CA-233914]|uniref:ribokinase n=1 Tax=Dactylosporangium sp. CA-233914 TaxID=3239934 RepID=UPI003D91C6FF
MTSVVVLGSANADLVVEVSRRPGGGETLTGSDLRVYPGGKGANQAAAAARAGATVRFLGCVGNDANATVLHESLSDAGVDLTGVRSVDRATGTAMILITPDGENSIVVSPGANHSLDPDLADEMADTWQGPNVLVMNLEIPLETVHHVVPKAAAARARIILNAAPAHALNAELLTHCDPLIVNEHEARIVLRESNPDVSYPDLAKRLLEAGARSVVITLGPEGSLVADSHGVQAVPAYRVQVLDTTGAGDAFVGATACELANGKTLIEAVRFATAMSALSVQSMGAQSSYPDRADVERLLDSPSNATTVANETEPPREPSAH